MPENPYSMRITGLELFLLSETLEKKGVSGSLMILTYKLHTYFNIN